VAKGVVPSPHTGQPAAVPGVSFRSLVKPRSHTMQGTHLARPAIRVATVTMLLLLVPLVAMQLTSEVSWSLLISDEVQQP
jgi:hypothetical protein